MAHKYCPHACGRTLRHVRASSCGTWGRPSTGHRSVFVHPHEGDDAVAVGLRGKTDNPVPDLRRPAYGALKGVEWCHTISAGITAERVEGSGDLAYARGTYRLSLKCKEDTPIDSEGVFLSVHRRLEDGTWRIESLLQPD